MRLWPFLRRTARPSADAVAADAEATRALTDAKALTSRADCVADKLSKTRERNHFAVAVAQRFRGA